MPGFWVIWYVKVFKVWRQTVVSALPLLENHVQLGRWVLPPCDIVIAKVFQPLLSFKKPPWFLGCRFRSFAVFLQQLLWKNLALCHWQIIRVQLAMEVSRKHELGWLRWRCAAHKPEGALDELFVSHLS